MHIQMPDPHQVTQGGGGSMAEIFDAAAEYWETAITDGSTVSIDYGWVNLPGNGFGQSFLQGTSYGAIAVDNVSTAANYYLDNTPRTNEEYNVLTPFTANLGGGTVNTGRRYSSPTSSSDASGRYDLLTILMHEIGHIIGVNSLFSSFSPITSPLPFAGTSIPNNGFHFTGNNVENSIMYSPFGTSQRRTLSEIDILAVAQYNGYTSIDLNPILDPPFNPLGDYDGSGTVDAADYSKWRNDFGLTGTGLAADGNGNGTVDEADYSLWLGNLGAVSAGTVQQDRVPEPNASTLYFVILLLFAVDRYLTLQFLRSNFDLSCS